MGLWFYVRYVIVKPMVLRSQCPIIIGISLLVFVYIVPVIIPKIVVYIAFIVNPWYRPNRVACIRIAITVLPAIFSSLVSMYPLQVNSSQIPAIIEPMVARYNVVNGGSILRMFPPLLPPNNVDSV